MPAIPRSNIGQRQLPQVRVESDVPDFRGIQRGLGHISDVFGKIQETADATETIRLTGEASEELKSAVEATDREFADPYEYRDQGRERVREVYDRKISEASNENVRRAVTARLANDFRASERQVAVGYWRKTKDKADAEFLEAEAGIERQILKATIPEERERGFRQYAELLGTRIRNGFEKPDDAQQKLIKFNKSVNAATMNLLAQQSPEAFGAKYDAGEFAEHDAVDVQRALDIADRTTRQRDARDAKIGKEQSDALYRSFENLAGERKLDLDTLNAEARRLGWEPDKVNKLINMQIGVKVANPYEKQFIQQAMEPADRNAVYSMNDVREAEANLKRLAQNRQVSTQTSEYREAMRRLQGMSSRLTMTGDIKDRQSEFDARQAIQDVYRQYMPGPRDERVQSEIAGHLRTIDGLDGAGRRGYVNKIESDLKTRFEKQKTPQVQIDQLRGKLKK